MGSPISAHRQTIKRLRPQIFFFRCFSLGPRPLCGWYSILLNRSLNLDLHALAWAIRSVTHLVLACFVSWSFAPFSSTRCSRTTSYAQPRFTTGSRKSSVPSGVHSVRRALVRVGPTGLSRPTLCRLTVRSNRRKNSSSVVGCRSLPAHALRRAFGSLRASFEFFSADNASPTHVVSRDRR